MILKQSFTEVPKWFQAILFFRFYYALEWFGLFFSPFLLIPLNIDPLDARGLDSSLKKKYVTFWDSKDYTLAI